MNLKIILFIIFLYPLSLFSSVAGFRYVINETGVYYGYFSSANIDKKDLKLLKGADPKTFVSYNNMFGKDKKHAYFLAKRMKGVDINSFEYIDYAFAKDKKHVYYQEKALNNIMPQDVQYIKDFRYISNSYLKDRYNVYYIDTVISQDPDSFKILPYYYCKDSKFLYFFDGLTHKILEGANPEDYIQDGYYIISNKKVFLFGEETHFDVDSFQKISTSRISITDSRGWDRMPYSFTYDKNGYYINGFLVASPHIDIYSHSCEFNSSKLNMYEYTTPYPTLPRTTKGIKFIKSFE